MNNRDLQRMLNGSFRYEFFGTVLEITGYNDGKRIAIDLGRITDEMFDELVEDIDEEEW